MPVKKTSANQSKSEDYLEKQEIEDKIKSDRKKEIRTDADEVTPTEQLQQTEKDTHIEQDKSTPKQEDNEHQEDKKYENASICFEVSKSEYENEKTRTNTIDSKIAIVTAIVTAVLLIIAETTDFNSLLSRTVSNAREIISVTVLICLIFGSIALISIALVVLAITIITRRYSAIDPRWFAQVENLDEEKSIYYLIGSEKYIQCCEENRKVNGQRCKKYDLSVKLLTIGFILFLAFFVLKFFL